MEPSYRFEKVIDGGYQVRLKGEFVTYVDRKDPELVDELLRESGYANRTEFLSERWAQV